MIFKRKKKIIDIDTPNLPFRKEIKKNMFLYLLTVPAIISCFVLNYIPLVGIVTAFQRYSFEAPFFGLSSPFVGFDNFKFIFGTMDAFYFTRNTLLYNVLFMGLGVVLGVTFAALITEINNRKIARIYQSVSYFPTFISYIVISFMLFMALNSEYGFVNKILAQFGVARIDWYNEPKYWPFILTLSHVWKGLGAGSIIYIATIAGFDSQLYEAAFLEGASKFQQFKRITLPLLKPLMAILIIRGFGNIFRSDFALFNFMPRGNGMLTETTLTLDVYIFRALLGGGVGGFELSAAAGLFQSIVGLIFLLTVNTIIRKKAPDYALF